MHLYEIRTHNETLSIVPMRVSNPDRSSVGINRRDAASTRKTKNVSTTLTRFQ